MCLAAARMRDGKARLRNPRVVQQGARKVFSALMVVSHGGHFRDQGRSHVLVEKSVVALKRKWPVK